MIHHDAGIRVVVDQRGPWAWSGTERVRQSLAGNEKDQPSDSATRSTKVSTIRFPSSTIWRTVMVRALSASREDNASRSASCSAMAHSDQPSICTKLG